MDSTLFDRMVFRLASPSRRTVLGGVLGLLSAGIAGRQSEGKKKKNKKKKCRRGTTRCGKRCANLRTDVSNCGACGAACGVDRACTNGACACPTGKSLVQGACIPTFGCTAQMDSCTATAVRCPQKPELTDAFCLLTADGQPFCGDQVQCVKLAAQCAPVNGKQQLLFDCQACDGPSVIGICTLPIT